MELHGTGYLQALAKGEFKKDAFAMQRELTKPRPVRTIFDVGANRGDISHLYHDVFPEAEIHAFEPFPQTYGVLEENFSGATFMHCVPKALSNTEGVRQLYVNKNVDTNSLLKPTRMGLSSDSQVENLSRIDIQTTTLDIYCAQNGIERIDILKMDVQGGELDILKGAQRLLEQNKIGLIYTETYFLEQYEGHPLFHEISGLLHKYGFYLQDIYSPIYGKGCLAWADVIFVKRDH